MRFHSVHYRTVVQWQANDRVPGGAAQDNSLAGAQNGSVTHILSRERIDHARSFTLKTQPAKSNDASLVRTIDALPRVPGAEKKKHLEQLYQSRAQVVVTTSVDGGRARRTFHRWKEAFRNSTVWPWVDTYNGDTATLLTYLRRRDAGETAAILVFAHRNIVARVADCIDKQPIVSSNFAKDVVDEAAKLLAEPLPLTAYQRLVAEDNVRDFVSEMLLLQGATDHDVFVELVEDFGLLKQVPQDAADGTEMIRQRLVRESFGDFHRHTHRWQKNFKARARILAEADRSGVARIGVG